MATPAIVVSGVSSGVGKTSLAIGLMAALTKRGLRVQPFKVGPDFLDPMHHTLACGVASVNLDGFMMGRDECLATYHRACVATRADIAVIEGCMGLFDGTNGASDGGSSAEIAKWLHAPVVLVVDAWCIGRSAAAMVHGYCSFDRNVSFAGVVFNKIGGDAHAQWLRDAMQSSPLTQSVRVLGCVPKDVSIVVPERHLGLHMPDNAAHIHGLARLVEAHICVDTLLAMHSKLCMPVDEPLTPRATTRSPPVRLGVARDEAFCFYYADNLRVLEAVGFTLEFFSPLLDVKVPNVHALYFGGGYPELHATALEANASMRASVRTFAASGKLVYAECGGLMYLAQKLFEKGKAVAMAGVLPIDVSMTPRMTMGYCVAELSVALATLLQLPRATALACHQYHFSELTYKDQPAALLDADGAVVQLAGVEAPAYQCRMERPDAAFAPEGVVLGGTIASYCHLHFGSHPAFASALLATAKRRLPLVSFEPSATEIVGAIWDSRLPCDNDDETTRRAAKKALLCAVSEFCDAPAHYTTGVPRITKSLITATTSEAIEAQVQAFHAQGIRDLHVIDTTLLATCRSGVVFTQDACDRCSAVDSAVALALDAAHLPRDVAFPIQPRTVSDVLDGILAVGRVLGEDARATQLHAALTTRLDAVVAKVDGLGRPRVLGLESVFPLVASGQWLPDMRCRAGGSEALADSSPGCPPRRLSWPDDIVPSRPDVLVVACCGKSAFETVRDMEQYLLSQDGFWQLPAMLATPPRLFAVDHGVLSRPGPNIILGIEILAGLLHSTSLEAPPELKHVCILQYRGPRFATGEAFVSHFEPVLASTERAPPSTEPAWRTLEASGPPALAAHAVVASRDTLYLVGGEDTASTRTSAVWQWTPSQSWELLPCATVYGEDDVPTARSNHAAALWHHILLVFGGWDQDGLQPLGQLELLNLDTRCWTHGSTTGAAPSSRGNPTLVVDAQRSMAIVFGGWNKIERFNDVHLLDLRTWAWREVRSTAVAPQKRTDHAAVWADDRMFVLGGSTCDGPMNDVWVWSPSTEAWSELHCSGDLPAPRTSHAAAVCGRHILMTGGQSHTTARGTSVFASSYALNIDSLEWTALPNLPLSICRHGTAVLGDVVYAFGGYDGHHVTHGLHELSVSAAALPSSPVPASDTKQAVASPAVANEVLPVVSWAPTTPLTLNDLVNDPSMADDLAEIDEVELDEQPSERYRLLHKVACDRGYLQYVDPASGYTVFTAIFLKKRACCGYKCRHCPWGHKNVAKNKTTNTHTNASLEW
ncbi:hypothetical protein SDRG_01916 [Saprolegnia diclina VS20]|uniref:Uncharacterized protein n=1 Tax=Saprolegnia diclina (strain VS20) TaxID=1156394 RepID=T0QRT0_SAPDV|nr:hypothetical protein SDRG_01916 [Saprolegnia diclina VS20]EQC40849.1 hypothetical protein SDRG_01916 [Saprolegnia diclina VS20]|eukprot:XP_008605693.1 hypothetical protein SDRG_01916 [Saprolegnia diclina VS20]